MLRDAVRGVVVVASELAEETGKRVLGAAEGLLGRAGVDVAEVERRIAAQFPPSTESLQRLAGEALTAGRAGVDLAVGVARGEVERIFERVGDQVVKVGVVLSFLENKLREVEGQPVPATGPEAQAGSSTGARAGARADGLFGAGWETAGQAVPVDDGLTDTAAAASTVAGVPFAAAPKPPAEKAAAESTAAETTVVKKAAAKKSAAKKAAAQQAAGEQTAGEQTAGDKAAVKKAAAKKAVTRKAAASAVTAAAAPAARKAAAAKKTVVRKSAAGKRTKGQDGDE